MQFLHIGYDEVLRLPMSIAVETIDVLNERARPRENDSVAANW